jgi:hypothetical protein
MGNLGHRFLADGGAANVMISLWWGLGGEIVVRPVVRLRGCRTGPDPGGVLSALGVATPRLSEWVACFWWYDAFLSVRALLSGGVSWGALVAIFSVLAVCTVVKVDIHNEATHVPD